MAVRRRFADFLLGTEVSESYTLDEFKQFFPVKFREHSDIKSLYKAFQMKRKKIRELVKRNIKIHCSSTPLVNVEDKTSSDAEDHIAENEKTLRQELSFLDEEMTTVREQLNSCLETLEGVDWFHGLYRKDFDLKKAQELSEQLGMNIS